MDDGITTLGWAVRIPAGLRLRGGGGVRVGEEEPGGEEADRYRALRDVAVAEAGAVREVLKEAEGGLAGGLVAPVAAEGHQEDGEAAEVEVVEHAGHDGAEGACGERANLVALGAAEAVYADAGHRERQHAYGIEASGPKLHGHEVGNIKGKEKQNSGKRRTKNVQLQINVGRCGDGAARDAASMRLGQPQGLLILKHDLPCTQEQLSDSAVGGVAPSAMRRCVGGNSVMVNLVSKVFRTFLFKTRGHWAAV